MSVVAREEIRTSAKPGGRAESRKLPLYVETIGLRILALVIFLAAWEATVATGILTEFWISRPALVFNRLIEMLITKATIWDHLQATLVEALTGLAGGAFLGIISGFALAKWRRVQVALDPYVMGIYGLPRVALAPLFIMWLGIGVASKIVLAGFVTYFVLLISTHVGVKQVDNDLINAVKTMGGQGSFLVRKVILPGCVPFILSGMRIGLGLSLTGAVVAELLAAQKGIGWVIARASGTFDTTGVFASLVVLAVVAVLLNEGMKKIEQYLLRWQGEVVL
ncbi:MAG: ABC transporter permease [Chloroflexi bacterium]|nr:ABC transporter permease [Chloroflexota bacterium]